jgi:Flp pilus assembly protein TadD
MRFLYLLIISFLLLTNAFSQEIHSNTSTDLMQQYLEQAEDLQASGDLKGAASAYKKALNLDSDGKTEIYNNLGIIYEALGYDKTALSMYKKALALDQQYLPVYTNLSLFYERRGDLKKASEYWLKRVQYGDSDDYWHEKARQRLIKLGAYPQIKKDILEKSAVSLSREIVQKKEQDKKADNENARLHLKAANSLLDKGDYGSALKELEYALSLNPDNPKLRKEIASFYFTAKQAYIKKLIKHYMQEAILAVDDNDYLAAAKKIKKTLSILSRFPK